MRRILPLLLALAACAMPFARGADQPASAPQREELAARMQEISDRLQLTEEQKTQIAPIVTEELRALKELRENTSLRRIQKAKRLKEITDAASTQIRALLTPEQQVEYDKLRAEMREKLKARAKERKDAAAAGEP